MINGRGGERGDGGMGFEPISYLPPPTTGTGIGYESCHCIQSLPQFTVVMTRTISLVANIFNFLCT